MDEMLLGNGKTTIVFAGCEEKFAIDLFGWLRWWQEVGQTITGGQFALLDVVSGKFAEETGYAMNMTEAYEFIHQVVRTALVIKKKREEELMSLISTASTLSG